MNTLLKNILIRFFIPVIWLSFIFIQAGAQYLSNLNPKSVTYIDSLALPDVFQTHLKSLSGGKLLDSVYYYDPDTGVSAWNQTQSTLYRYNTSNLLSDKISRYWSGQEEHWKEYLKRETSYYPPGLKNEEITKAWDSEKEVWENRMKNTYNYDSLHLLNQLVNAYWNSGTQSWRDSIRYSYNFDEEGNWIYYLRETRIADSLSWRMDYRFSFSYENGNKTTLLRQNYRADSSQWINSNRIVYTYDLPDRLISETGDVWDADSSKWDKNSRIKYLYYETGNLSDKIYKAWKPEGWSHYARYKYSWDEQGNNINIVYFTWSSIDSIWNENAAYLYEYDGDGDLTREIWQNFDIQNSEWENTFKIDYFFSYTTHKEELKLSKIRIFPNPFTENLTIGFETDFSNQYPVWLSITDLNGRPLYSMRLRDSRITLTGLNLSPGIYLLRITTGNQIFSWKIVKE